MVLLFFSFLNTSNSSSQKYTLEINIGKCDCIESGTIEMRIENYFLNSCGAHLRRINFKWNFAWDVHTHIYTMWSEFGWCLSFKWRFQRFSINPRSEEWDAERKKNYKQYDDFYLWKSKVHLFSIRAKSQNQNFSTHHSHDEILMNDLFYFFFCFFIIPWILIFFFELDWC